MIVNKYANGGGGSASGVTPEQVQQQIDSALTPYWESGETKDYVDEAVSGIDLSNYYTSAQTEEAISAATSGKADAANVTARGDQFRFPYWNAQGVITGETGQLQARLLNVNGASLSVISSAGSNKDFYAPTAAGNAGDILVSTGNGAPVWSAVTGPDMSGYYTSAQTDAAIAEAVSGKADAKIMVDFDHTTQAERAAVYAELKALYDGGSGATINKNYDFYKTVNTWQGQKIDYYTFSGGTLVFGQVVSPENLEDQVAYVQVMEIDSAGNVTVQTNTIGAADMSEYYTSAQTDEAIASAASITYASAVSYADAAIAGIDLSSYALSADVETLSAATAGKADAANVTANNNFQTFARWNSQGVITGAGNRAQEKDFDINGNRFRPLTLEVTSWPRIWAPLSVGTAGDVLVSTGDGAPVWSAMTFITSADVETQILSKNYTTSAETKTYVDSAVTGVQDQIDTMDEVVSQALVDLDGRVDAISAATPDLSPYWTSAQTENAISAATQNMVISTDVRQIVKLTQAAYDQLATKDPYAFYIIVNSNSN